ncbi:hypothetical protein HPB50_026417 [Hyalomma asiaticum]|uniref:Uncharacterized protein n=1 Tax=Hyalomma asiaticum TaxID=266040 RepID=A0ACB7RSY6_HYAAI|nr:hypothetical protein HPB50_026417 [Hyalomma asiaticum]
MHGKTPYQVETDLQIMVGQMQEKLTKMKRCSATDTQNRSLICGENHFTSSPQRVGKFRKFQKPTSPQGKHGQQRKEGGPQTSPKAGAKQQPKQNKSRETNAMTAVGAACLPGRGFPLATKPAKTVEFSMCDISARMHCLAETRSKIGKYANAMRVSNSTAPATARPTFFRFISFETRAPNLRQTVPKGDAASVRGVRSTLGKQRRNARVAVASVSSVRD